MTTVLSPIPRMIRLAFPGGPRVPPDIIDPTNVYKNAYIQQFCLNTITILDNLLNSPGFLEKVLYFVRFSSGPVFVTDLFSFHLKGGNALPLLKIDVDPSVKFPYNFTGDFDLALLINPALKKENFKVLREIAIYELIDMLKMIVLQKSDWQYVIASLVSSGYRIKNLDAAKIVVASEAYTYDDFGLGEHLYDHPRLLDFLIPAGCPFELLIHPNLPYKEKSQNFALIKLRTRTDPVVDLIDIAIPSSSYKNIKFEWDIHRTLYFKNETFNFRIADSLNTYIDFRISAFTDSRNTKKKTRTNRADTIRNTILKPLLKSGHLKKETVESFKLVEYNHPEIKDLKNILSDVHE